MTDDTATAVDDPTGETRLPTADTLGTLAVCWREPSEELRTAVESDAIAWLDESEAAVDLDDLRVEYTRLFIGPGPEQCPPYESVYRDGDHDGDEQNVGPVYGPATQAVARWYAEYGLELRDSRSAPPDHIATELEFAAYLAATEDDDTLEQFLDEHPRTWIEPFAARLRENDPGPFYRAVIERTIEVLTR
ncbi:molecular chaperone (plasmid) [Halomicrobium sp. HM KBTZ05]|uniref:TorD/DmsD family molecular chaperone n=1 Tax=Halomicrobium sp. HM KBTZ05 TaxID=3242663 RepID=UPI003556DEAA